MVGFDNVEMLVEVDLKCMDSLLLWLSDQTVWLVCLSVLECIFKHEQLLLDVFTIHSGVSLEKRLV